MEEEHGDEHGVALQRGPQKERAGGWGLELLLSMAGMAPCQQCVRDVSGPLPVPSGLRPRAVHPLAGAGQEDPPARQSQGAPAQGLNPPWRLLLSPQAQARAPVASNQVLVGTCSSTPAHL